MVESAQFSDWVGELEVSLAGAPQYPRGFESLHLRPLFCTLARWPERLRQIGSHPVLCRFESDLGLGGGPAETAAGPPRLI